MGRRKIPKLLLGPKRVSVKRPPNEEAETVPTVPGPLAETATDGAKRGKRPDE